MTEVGIDFGSLRQKYEGILYPPIELHFDLDLPMLSSGSEHDRALSDTGDMSAIVTSTFVQAICRDPYAMFQPLASSTNSANTAMRELVRTVLSGIITGGSHAPLDGVLADLERAIRHDTASGRFCYELVRLIAGGFQPLACQTVTSKIREDMRFSPEILTFVEILLGGNNVSPDMHNHYDTLDDSALIGTMRELLAATIRRAGTNVGFDFSREFFSPSM
jgi:hypothetical protein